MMPARLSVLFLALFGTTVLAEDAATEQKDVFTLGQIEVTAKSENRTAQVISDDDIRRQGATNVGEAVQYSPGIVIENGGRRAETKVNIRGFDSRQVTLNLDGIPIHVPYDGNIDLSRFRTSDLSQIEITKGLGSLLEGPNNMGGSVNLVTRKPTRALEGRVDIGVEMGEDGLFKNAQNLQVGSASEKVYVTAGVSRLENGDFPLSSSYSPVDPSVQDKGSRNRSGNESATGNVKIGYTPNRTDEYALSYYNTQSRKQSSPYAGDTSLTGESVRYWDWPMWDKESVYFLSHTEFGESYVDTTLFYDNFKNKLYSYDDDTYSTINFGYAFRSEYDDHSLGAKVQAGTQAGIHALKAALFIKEDEHKERDLKKDNSAASFDESWRTYQGHTYSLGLEDSIDLSERTQMTVGYRQDQFKMTKTDDGDPNTVPSKEQSTGNFQIKAFHELAGQTLFAGVSSKSRFPNIKDIYSYRLGSAIPNTDLDAEQALHYEIGAKGQAGQLRYQASVYRSDISDAIESVSVTPSLCGATATSCSQNKNVGEASAQGLEVELMYAVSDALDTGLSYAYLDRELADSSLKATNAPEHTARVYVDWMATQDLGLGADWFMQSERESTTNGLRSVDGYQLVSLHANYQINRMFSTQAVLKNATDADYEIAEGDPMPGRTLWLNLSAEF